jgi:hypothetical protein
MSVECPSISAVTLLSTKFLLITSAGCLNHPRDIKDFTMSNQPVCIHTRGSFLDTQPNKAESSFVDESGTRIKTKISPD